MAYNDTGFKAFVVGASAITAGTRVALSSGLLVAATAVNGNALGVALSDAAAGTTTTIKLNSAPGTVEILANAAISVGAAVYPAASGKISPTTVSSNNAIGIALEAASADGDRIEVALQPQSHA